MTPKQMIAIPVAMLIVFVIATFLSRATPRRFGSALIGGVLAAIAGCVSDSVGHSLGWWYYVGASTAHAPPLIYVGVSFWSATVALIAWRVARRLGWPGQFVVIALAAVCATIQDYVAGFLKFGNQIIAPGIMSFVGDIMVWTIVVLVALAVMRALAGPANGDRLART